MAKPRAYDYIQKKYTNENMFFKIVVLCNVAVKNKQKINTDCFLECFLI